MCKRIEERNFVCALRDNILNHMSFLDAGESLIESLEAICQSFMIDSQQVHHRGMDVADFGGTFGDFVSEIVCASIGDSRFHAATCHPDGIGVFLMVATTLFRILRSLQHRGTTKLSPPD